MFRVCEALTNGCSEFLTRCNLGTLTQPWPGLICVQGTHAVLVFLLFARIACGGCEICISGCTSKTMRMHLSQTVPTVKLWVDPGQFL